jgi:hypothetical protein
LAGPTATTRGCIRGITYTSFENKKSGKLTPAARQKI